MDHGDVQTRKQSRIRRELFLRFFASVSIDWFHLGVMPILGPRNKRNVARQINSRALEADSRQTDLCVYLSAIALGGLALNALFGGWWADPIAALNMVPIIAKERVQALRGETCDDCDG